MEAKYQDEFRTTKGIVNDKISRLKKRISLSLIAIFLKNGIYKLHFHFNTLKYLIHDVTAPLSKSIFPAKTLV